MSRKSNRSGLFNGHWDRVHDDDGDRRNVRIQRSEYAELYRLHRLCTWIEQDVGGAETRTVSSRSNFTPSPLREHPAYTEANPFH